MLKYRKVIFWYNRNNQSYYIKKYKSWSFVRDYKVGFINQYNHEILYILDTNDLEYPREPLKTRLIKKVIRFLEDRLKGG